MNDDRTAPDPRAAREHVRTVDSELDATLFPEEVDRETPPLQALTFDARYTKESILGQGGMGSVLLSADRLIGRRIAVKVIRAESAAAEASLERRFLREARVQGQLEHPSVVPVYDLGRTPEGSAYFTMKRIHGVTLAEVLERLRAGDAATAERYSQRRLLAAFASVCLAIEFAHERGVIHRDLKPSNIMLGDFGEIYVLDWGIARVEDAVDGDPTAVDARLDLSGEDARTEVGAVLGTLGYMPPEQVLGGTIGPTADVYALGAVLFELLTQEPLYNQASPRSIASATLRGVETRPSIRFPGRTVAPELEALCVHATQPAPSDRPAHARDLSDAIERFLDGERNLGMRREMATRHTEAADRVLATSALTNDQRQLALGEIAQALALDPDNAQARGTLLRLLTEPPQEVPAEVERELEALSSTRVRTSATVAGFAYLSMLLYVPILLWSGVRDLGALIALHVGILGLSLASFRVGRSPSARPRSVVPVLLANGVVFSIGSGLYGPLVLVPSMVAGTTLGFALLLERRQRVLAFVVGALTVLAPLALEALHVLPTAYGFEGGSMIIYPSIIHFAPTPTMILLATTAVTAILTGGISVGRMRDELTAAERRMNLQAWQLRQLVPRPSSIDKPA